MVVDVGVVKNHIKPKADSTLHNMRKDDLIEYIRCLEHNYNVAVSFNENQARYVESLGLPIGWIPVTERLPDGECIALGFQNEMPMQEQLAEKILAQMPAPNPVAEETKPIKVRVRRRKFITPKAKWRYLFLRDLAGEDKISDLVLSIDPDNGYVRFFTYMVTEEAM